MISLLKRHKFSGILAATAAILLIGCSGGESGTGMQASSQQTTVGVITGFGSVFVNGVEFDTNQAAVSIDGVPSSESSLSVGMVVTVNGSVNSDGVTGTAISVATRTEVKGMVLATNITGGTGTISVMGQTVKISNDTKFKSEVTGILTIDQLVANSSIVEVSGFTDGQGNIYATYVKELASGGEVKLHGAIQDLTGTSDNSTFRIGTVTFTFNNVDTQFHDVTQAQLVNGMYVYVEGVNTGSTTPLLASKISREQYADSEGSEYELEGVVTDISNLGGGEFKVNNGISIRFDASTSFEHGIQSDIQLEATIEVGGSVQADGSILADKISFRKESDMEIEGTVTSVGDNMLTISDASGDTVISVNEFTSYEDESAEQVRTFNFSDIMPGMTIEAKYYVDAVDGNIATSIEKVMM